MTVSLVPLGEPATEMQVLRVEKLIGSALPDDYRRFMLTSNGATPETDANPHGYVGFPVAWQGQSWATRYDFVLLDALYAFDDESDLPWQSAHEAFVEARRIPDDTIPIGLDPGGNQILLGITGANRGKVFFWAQDFAPIDDDEPVTYENVGLISGSFDEFLEKLEPWEEAG